jgi:hypothetical protein
VAPGRRGCCREPVFCWMRACAAWPHRALRFAPNRVLARIIVRATSRVSAHAGCDPSRKETLTAFPLTLIQFIGALTPPGVKGRAHA